MQNDPAGKDSFKLASSATPNAPSIDALPDDLLHEIFALILPSAKERTRAVSAISFNSADPPMVLCLVCKRWNDVAKDCASLWTSLRLLVKGVEDDVSPGPLNPHPHLSDAISRCLERWERMTKASPIQLQIVSVQRGVQGWHIGSLSPGAYQRMTKLSLCKVPCDALEELPPNSFPVLEDLILKIINSDAGERNPVRAFEGSSLLKRLAVGIEDSVWRDLRGLLLPWHQLTHLLILSPTPTQLNTSFLEHCPYLQHLHLCPDINVDREGVVPVFNHGFYYALMEDNRGTLPKTTKWYTPRLTSLTINFTSDGRPEIFYVPNQLKHIEWTQLQSLRLTAYSMDASTVAAFANKMTNLGGQCLRHLTLAVKDIDTGSLAPLWRCTPNLITLELQAGSAFPLTRFFGVRWNPEGSKPTIFSALNEHSVEDLLPSLKTLVVELLVTRGSRLRLSPSDKEELVSFVKKRAAASGAQMRLEKLVLRERGDLSSGSLVLEAHEVEELRRQGLAVECQELSAYEVDSFQSWYTRDVTLLEEWPEVQDVFLWSPSFSH